MTPHLTGVWTLVRFAVRRQRLALALWIVLLGGLPAVAAAALADLYPSEAERAELAAGLANPAIEAIYGPVLSDSIGGLTAWRTLCTGAALTGLLAILTVIKHTRAEEESGRLELVGAGVVGRYAPLAAATITALGATTLLGLFITITMAPRGAAGALALGVAYASCGWVFTGVAVLAAQLATTGRTAIGLASAVLGISFALRAAADVSSASWLGWFSPIGWSERIAPYAHDRWWILALSAGTAIVVGALGYALLAHRDLGGGLLAPRLGPATGGIGSIAALRWRQERGMLLGWLAGMVVLAVVVGGVADDVDSIADASPSSAEVIREWTGGGSLIDAFLASCLGIAAILVSAYVISVLHHLRTDEVAGRGEQLLSTRVPRHRWLLTTVALAALASAALLLEVGVIAGAVHGIRSSDAGQLWTVTGGALVQLPVVWLFIGVAALGYGALPRFPSAPWAAFAAAVFISQFGPLFQWQQWLLDLSPFTHVPKLPGSELQVAPLAWLLVAAIALVSLGVVTFRRRDID